VTAAEGELRALVDRLAKSRQSLQALETSVADKRASCSSWRRLSSRQSKARNTARRRPAAAGAAPPGRAGAERNREQRQQFLDLLAANREADGQLREELERSQERLHRSQLRTTQLDSELSFAERTLADEYRITLEEAEQRAQPIESRTAAREQVKVYQAQIDALGEVNLGAVEEYERVKERLEFLGTQRADLEKAREDIEQTITQIDTEATSRFLSAFDELNREFQTFFTPALRRRPCRADPHRHSNVLDSGVDVSVTVPGRRRAICCSSRRRTRAHRLGRPVRDAQGEAIALRHPR